MTHRSNVDLLRPAIADRYRIERELGTGGTLFFESGGQSQTVSIMGESDVQISEPRTLFSLAGYRRARNRQQYDVAPGDQRFLMIKDPPAPPIPTVVLVENWFPELLAKVKP